MRETGQRERILEAAKRRFAHFGIAKTSLTEIADDLALTKQALSYYFPDKQSLIREVTAGLLGQYLEQLEQQLKANGSVHEALLELVGLRGRFSRQYYLFFTQLEHDGQWFNRAAKATLLRLARREQLLLEARLERGVSLGELRTQDVRTAVRTLLDTLTMLGRVNRGCPPDEKVFAALEEKQRALITLIYNGLGNKPWKN
ncbi:TetR/AcrR family transcriptional regulator [Flaviaesturariibacter aridisoli]|uniref:TetR/AcrR family transcriptional regulator n=1 Tax=Flaviaesturariibacter aridisoli TaxID=2545761 RepID=A0A4R4E1L0_9BACT|nr:TetR/AcrR family transcriptional regulator [Flaviaesturariibacter aridisoli]TCZ73374.1 TetR/AcrR family transcriptional regulator [Flaviaesturariibacter aridisoli]